MTKTQATELPKSREPAKRDTGPEQAGEASARATDDRLATETAAARQEGNPKPQTKAK